MGATTAKRHRTIGNHRVFYETMILCYQLTLISLGRVVLESFHHESSETIEQHEIVNSQHQGLGFAVVLMKSVN